MQWVLYIYCLLFHRVSINILAKRFFDFGSSSLLSAKVHLIYNGCICIVCFSTGSNILLTPKWSGCWLRLLVYFKCLLIQKVVRLWFASYFQSHAFCSKYRFICVNKILESQVTYLRLFIHVKFSNNNDHIETIETSINRNVTVRVSANVALQASRWFVSSIFKVRQIFLSMMSLLFLKQLACK